MTKLPTTTKPGEVIPFNPPPFFRALDRLTEDADRIIRRFDEMEYLFGALIDGRPIELAACRRAATLSEHDEVVLARCREALRRFDPDSAYEDDDRQGDLRPGLIAERMALLVDSKSKGRPPNPQVYAEMMMEHLLAVEGLSLIALDSACREIREAKPYVPEISDLMPVLRRHLQAWQERSWAIFNLVDESRRLMERVEAREIEQQAAATARALQQQAAAKAHDIEQAQQKLEQARRDAIDAEDAYCEANAVLRDSEEKLAEAKQLALECENDLARAEAAASD